MIELAAVLYSAMIVAVIIFQFCLIGGAPWGRITQGGTHEGSLPITGRAFALISVFVLFAMGAGITSAANIEPNWPIWTTYAALGVQALSMILNWVTPSQLERQLWAPITTLMFSLAAYVVLG